MDTAVIIDVTQFIPSSELLSALFLLVLLIAVVISIAGTLLALVEILVYTGIAGAIALGAFYYFEELSLNAALDYFGIELFLTLPI